MFPFFSAQPQRSCKTDPFPRAWGIMSWPFHCFPVKLLLFSIWNYSLPAVSELYSKKEINKRSGSQHNAEEGKVVRAHKSSGDNGRGEQQPASHWGRPWFCTTAHFPRLSHFFSACVTLKLTWRHTTTTGDADKESVWTHPPHEPL